MNNYKLDRYDQYLVLSYYVDQIFLFLFYFRDSGVGLVVNGRVEILDYCSK